MAPTLEPTPEPAAQPSPTAQPASDLASQLQGLDIDAFFERSWRELMMRDPEWVLSEGLGSDYELATAELTDILDAYQRETIAMQPRSWNCCANTSGTNSRPSSRFPTTYTNGI